MIFFTVFFGTFPIFLLLVIPAIMITKAIDCHGVEPFTKKMAWQAAGYGATISAGISGFMAAITWIGKVWIPLMSTTFGAL